MPTMTGWSTIRWRLGPGSAWARVRAVEGEVEEVEEVSPPTPDPRRCGNTAMAIRDLDQCPDTQVSNFIFYLLIKYYLMDIFCSLLDPVVGRRAVAGAGDSAVAAQIEELSQQVLDMKLTIEGLEKERDFYFGKLRDIEVRDAECRQTVVARQHSYSPPVPDRGAGDGRGQRRAGEGDPRHPLRHRGGVRRARGGRRRGRSRVLTTQRMKI